MLDRLDALPTATAKTAELREVLATRFATVVDKSRSQLSAAIEIDQAWGDSGRRPVLFKGVTAFVLTERLSRMRPAGDLDVICDDVEQYRSLLPSLGYEEVRFHTTGHEIGAFHRGDICIELHRFSPVCWVPPQNGTQALGFRHDGEIPYPIFAANHVRAPVGDLGTITVPTPTLAAVIACTNLYKDYALSGFPRPFGTMPLGHLAEIVDFAGHPDFDPDRFVEIAHECRAQDSVELVEAMLKRHRLTVPDALSVAASDTGFYPRNLAVGYAFIDDKPGADEQLLDDLVLRCSSFGDYLGCLSPSLVRAGTDKDSASHYAIALGEGDSIAATVDTGKLDIQFCVLLTESGLRFDVSVRSDGASFEVLVDFGDHGLWGTRNEMRGTLGSQIYQRLTKIRGIPFAEADSPIDERDGVSRFSVELPPESFAHAVSNRQLAALLALRTFDEEQRAVVIPIRIKLPWEPEIASEKG
jgi:hypothetical protein